MFEFEWLGKRRYLLIVGGGGGSVALLIDLATRVGIEHYHLGFGFVLGKVLQWALFGLLVAWLSWHADYE